MAVNGTPHRQVSAARSDFDCFQTTGQKNLLDPFPPHGSCKDKSSSVRSPVESAERGSASVQGMENPDLGASGLQGGVGVPSLTAGVPSLIAGVPSLTTGVLQVEPAVLHC